MFTPPVLVYYETYRCVQQHCQHQHVCAKYCSWLQNKIVLCDNNVRICMCVPHAVVYCEPGWCVAIVPVSVYICHLQLFTVKLDSNVWQHCQYMYMRTICPGTLNMAYTVHVQIHMYTSKHLVTSWPLCTKQSLVPVVILNTLDLNLLHLLVQCQNKTSQSNIYVC